MDYADPQTRQILIEVIRPILPAIRNTPYGRRIQSKIAGPPASAFAGYPRAGSGNPMMPMGRRMPGMEMAEPRGGNPVNPNVVNGANHMHRMSTSSVNDSVSSRSDMSGLTSPPQHNGHQQFVAHHPPVHQDAHSFPSSFTGGDFTGYNYM